MRKITIDKEHLSAAMWVTIGVSFFLTVSQGISLMAEQYSIISTTIHIIVTLVGVQLLLKLTGLTVKDCKITLPRFNLMSIYLVLVVAVTCYFAYKTIPGQFVWSALSREAVINNLKVAYYHSVAIPIAEEIFFRGIIYKVYERCFGKVGGFIAVALVFSLAHAGKVSNIQEAMWQQLVLIPVAVFLGLLAVDGKNLWNSILAHGVINFYGHWVAFGVNNKMSSGFFTYLVEGLITEELVMQVRNITVTLPYLWVALLGTVMLIKKLYHSKKTKPALLEE